MSKIVQNGLDPGESILPDDSHELFQELCALSVAGELTAQESIRLERHLAACPSCRGLLEQYRYISATEIPRLAADLAPGPDEEGPAPSWSIDEAEKKLMDRLKTEPLWSDPRLPGSKVSIWSRPITQFAVAATLIGACSLVAFRSGVLEGRRAADGLRAGPSKAMPVVPSTAVPPSQPANVTSQPRQDPALQIRAKLDSSQKEVQRLEQQLSQLEAEMAKRESELAGSVGARADLERELAQAQADNEALQTKLQGTEASTSQDLAQSLALKVQVDGLNSAVEEKDKEIAHEQDLLEHDRDIRNLIGARNLYIAEIYDVGKTGETEKPFGRVFYTKDKSLIFYGYDLDQQRGVKKDSAFQAWGRRGSDHEHDVNLGLLYKDDASQKRWVLRFNDAKTVADLDAVFVTIEPQGGSATPSGKPLLFTYLRLEPNHP
jgi:anti-sigma-K factor RskA